ncbi:MAG: phage tail tape measure protein [Bacteroides sp.]|nr:phage tail tape measure protein [Bacteroides sp.]
MAETDGKVLYEVRADLSKIDGDLSAADRKVAQAAEKTAKKQEDAQKGTVKTVKQANSEMASDTEKAQKNISDAVKRESEKAAAHFKNNAEEMSQSGRKAAEEVEGSVSGMASSLISKIGQVAAAAASVKTLIGTMKAAIGEAVSAETSFAKVNTLLSENADKAAYFSDIKNASRSTGVVVSDLSEAVYSALSASVDESSAVDFTQSAVKLAKGGFTETATAVDVLTTAINAYSLKADDAVRVSDVLITTQNLGKTTVGELASSMGQTIPIANSAGAAIEDLAAQYAIMTKNGVATAESGTQIKAMLNELNASGTTVSDTLKELTGKSFADLQSSGKNTAEILNILKTHAEESGQKLSDMFGSVEAGAAALTLVKDGGADFVNVLEQMKNSAGATEKAYSTMANTTEERFNKLKNNLTIAVEEIGEKLLPSIEKFFNYIDENSEELGEIIEEVGEALSELMKITIEALKIAWEHKDVILAIVSAMAAYKAALAVSSLINIFKNAVNTAKIAQLGFNSAVKANPLGLIISLITTAIAAYMDYSETVKQAAQITEEYNNTVKEISEASENVIKNTQNEMAVLSDKVKRYDELRTSADRTATEEEELKRLAEELQSVFGNSVDVVDSLTGKYNDLTAALKNYSEQQVISATLDAHKKQLEEYIALQEEIEEKKKAAQTEADRQANEWYSGFGVLVPDWLYKPDFNSEVNAYGDQLQELWIKTTNIKEQIKNDSESLFDLIHTSGMDFVNTTDETGEKIISTTETVTAQIKTKFTDVQSALEQTKSKYDILTAATEEVNSAGALSVATLKNIASAYPQLQEHIDKYLAGLISEQDLLKELSAAYDEDQQEYYKYLLVKSGYAEDFVTAALDGSDIIADYFMENYKLDLKNYKDYISRKQAIQEAFDSYLAGGVSAWWTEENGWSSDFQHLKGDAQKAIMDIVNQYKDAMYDLDSWGEQQSMDLFQADFAKIRERTLSTLNADSKNNSTVSNGSSSKGSSSSSVSSPQSKTGSNDQIISITSYIPTMWDDAEKANQKLIAGGVAASLVGNSKSGKLISGLTSNTAAAVRTSDSAEASLSDVVKAIKGLEQSSSEMKCVVTAILNCDSVALARQTIKGVAAIEKTTGRKVFYTLSKYKDRQMNMEYLERVFRV